MRSSPVTWATRTATPRRPASSLTARAHPAGSSPPAFDTILMPRSAHVPSTCSIWVRNVRAYPGRPLSRLPARMSMVSSASQSPVSTSMGPPSTISLAADSLSP